MGCCRRRGWEQCPCRRHARRSLTTGQRQRLRTEDPGLIYSRINNPDLQILEERLTLWDAAEAGLAFSTGMSAISTTLLTYLRPGDVLLVGYPLDVPTAGELFFRGESLTNAGEARLKKLCVLADEIKICGDKEIDFRDALCWLGEKWKVKRLLCEGGGELNDALFRAGLVNELHLTICPRIFGGRDAPTIADGAGVLKLGDAARLRLKSSRRIGEELFLVYKVQTARCAPSSRTAGNQRSTIC